MTTLQDVELGVLGPLLVRQGGAPVLIPGAKPRALLTMLGLHNGSVVPADTLIELLWGTDPPRTAAKALQTHISALRRTLGDGFVLTAGAGWKLAATQVDASRYKSAARLGRDAATAGETSQALARFDEALALWRGVPELPDGRRGTSEKTRWIEGHAALVEDRADALLATGRAAELIGDLEAAVADAPLRERRWGQLMLALYRAGRQGEALGAYQRARSLLADELGVDPGPELRRLEAAVVAQDSSLDVVVAQHLPSVTRAVTFLLTDIEGSTAAWEAQAAAMAVALARHDELVEQVVTSRGGRLIKTRGEGDATFSVFDRPSAAAAAAIELQEAITHEPWPLREPMRIRVALHTGEVELRDGDYFGRAVNRAARLRSLAAGGQILCSGAVAELVIDSLADDVVLDDLGMRQLKNLARPEHVFELRLDTERPDEVAPEVPPIERPPLPPVLIGPGPFVGREPELERLLSFWQTGGTHAVLIAGEPGVGKTRLSGEWSQRAYDQGAVVLYGRCDEDLGAPYQPFAEALRSLVPCIGADRLQGLRGVEALLPLVPGLPDVVPDLAAPARSDPDTERYALFDAVVALLEIASAATPVVLILDDLHWAAKPTLLLLRHLLRFGDHARVQIVGTYRSTDLDRSHPLAAMLADLHRDGTANRLNLSGLDEDDVTAYVAEAGYDDEELAHALASVTGGNPFFLIEALRHVDESGGVWDQSTLPQGVREAVSRRLSRLSMETNKALSAAAVVGSRFGLELVEEVIGTDLIDALDEACQAGLVVEEPGGRYRFNHAIVRQSLLTELASVRRMRLHQRIAAALETRPGADDELLAELAHHYFECAWAGNAVKAVEYCRRAADQAMARLAYEGAADLYDHALHALEEIDDELPDRDDQVAVLLVARCEALLAAGDVTSAAGAVSQLQAATVDSAQLAAWATCFDGQLSMLIHPERLDEVEAALGVAAGKLAELDDAAGEAMAHTVRAGCLARLGRIGDGEVALDNALTAARRAREHRRVNAVLAGAPLAALWGPNPVPRAGGRCLDVVRLLRITTDSPAVEATSTRCQAVLESFRGRTAAARRMIDSARRTVSELGLRHALLEIEQFAGIVELVANDAEAAEARLRLSYNGFRRMGLDADTAETAALLGRACLALDRDAEADELCAESERLAGHALKAAIAWRTLRAHLLSRGGDHDGARRMAEAAVSLAERTDALVDHGDACLTLATVLGLAGDATGANAAATRATDLYERKGAAALAERARQLHAIKQPAPAAPAPAETPSVQPDTACARLIHLISDAIDRRAWDKFEDLYTTHRVVSRRKVVGFTHDDFPGSELRRMIEDGAMRLQVAIIAVRGERLALARLEVGTGDLSPGAPHDEMLQLVGTDGSGRVALEIFFDIEDMDAAMAELDAAYTRLEPAQPRPRLENTATRLDDRGFSLFAEGRFDEIGALYADDIRVEDRRQGFRGEITGRAAALENVQAIASFDITITNTPLALRGDRLCLSHVRFEEREAFSVETLELNEIDGNGLMIARFLFDPHEIVAAVAELDARYLAGEAADHAATWTAVLRPYAAINQRQIFATTPDWVNIDHRRGAAFAPGDANEYVRQSLNDGMGSIYIEMVHRLDPVGAVVTWAATGTTPAGFDAEWRGVHVLLVDGALLSRFEVFDEADLDTAIATFDQLSRPTPRLENAASRVCQRFESCYLAGDLVAVADTLADDITQDDRRRLVGAGIQQGRAAVLAEIAVVAASVKSRTTDVIATRGQHLVLNRVRSSFRDEAPGAFGIDVLDVIEVNPDDVVVARVVFDLDDFDAALAELDRRYLAGVAAAHAKTWSVIVEAYRAITRHTLPRTTPNWVNVDHRRGIAFTPGDLTAYIQDMWDTENPYTYIEAVHRLNSFGAVFVQVGRGSSADGFDAEWRLAELMTVEGELVSRAELFDEADLHAAVAAFERLSTPAMRLENAATAVYQRLQAYFAAGDWDAMAETLADDVTHDDRRRVVGAGLRHGRDAVGAEIWAVAEIGMKRIASEIIAIRGTRVALSRARSVGDSQRLDAFHADVLDVVEIDADGRVVARVVFDPDDLDAAVAELESRYLAGEAAPYADTWRAIAGSFTSITRSELPAMTNDLVTIDHRHVATFAPGELVAYIQAGYDLGQDIRTRIEAVHRLNNLGAVVSYIAYATSLDGFEGEWREIAISTVDGDRVNRCELFNETDLDAALATFEQLSRPAPRLENAAGLAAQRILAHLAARNWTAMAAMIADGFTNDDRRRVVGAGMQHGRDAEVADMQAVAELWTDVTSTVVAIRGERLALIRLHMSNLDQGAEAFVTEVLGILEIDSDERLLGLVLLAPDDFDAAFVELDARYLAGQPDTYAHAWSVISRSYAAMNRHELFPTTPYWVNVDHRTPRIIEEGDLNASLQSLWSLVPDVSFRVEAVHRLNEHGAVCSHVALGISNEGFAAEWRGIEVLTVDGDLINRCEIFGSADLDNAIAAFEQLNRSAPRLENATSQVAQRFVTHLAAGNPTAIAEMLAEDFYQDDRRRVVGAGLRPGLDAELRDMSTLVDLGVTNVTTTTVATRGRRLALIRTRFALRDAAAEPFVTEALGLAENDGTDRILAHVVFDADDLDGALAELDARYLAGEAAGYSRTWTAMAQTQSAYNRREVPPTTDDLVSLDHRRGRAFAPGEGIAFLRSTWNVAPDAKGHIEKVHRLNHVGAVVTEVVNGSSKEGFDFELREIGLFAFEGEAISRFELFDETDVEAALARFDELRPAVNQLENAATRVDARVAALFAARDWAAASSLMAEDISIDDRRHVVNAGVRRGRDAEIANMRARAGTGVAKIASTVIATRADRLALSHVRFSGHDPRPAAFHTEALVIVEIDATERIVARVGFDLDDIDTAFAELEARYLAGEAAPYAQTWSVTVGGYAALNRQQLPPMTMNMVSIDHRRGRAFEPGQVREFLVATWDLLPNGGGYVEAVHRLSDVGALVTLAWVGTSREGFKAEFREIGLTMVDGELFTRCELFDEADLEAALARFDELHTPKRRLDNPASQVSQRFLSAFAARNWDALAELFATDYYMDDRRKVVNAGLRQGQEAAVTDLRVGFEVGLLTVLDWQFIAARGSRLVIAHFQASGHDSEIQLEGLQVVELDEDELLAAVIVFDVDDMEAALAELEARYVAGEAAAHAHTWSVVNGCFAALSRHEIPLTTADLVDVDHRRGAAFEPGDLIEYLRAGWELNRSTKAYVEDVHCLNNFGAVVTHSADLTSRDGFEAEWRTIDILMVDGDMISRVEVFDWEDLDAAIVRFEEISSTAT